MVNPDFDYLVSRVIFDMVVDGNIYRDLFVDVKQPFGTNYAQDPVEVGPPQGGYGGPFPHAKFSDAVESYYRSLFGRGAAIDFGGPGPRQFRNNLMLVQSGPFELDMDVPESVGGWQLTGEKAPGVWPTTAPPLVVVENQEYRGKIVLLDGYHFIKCKFHDGKVVYRGTGPVVMTDCEVNPAVGVVFDGPAQNTLMFMRGLYHGIEHWGASVIESIFKDLRDNPPQTAPPSREGKVTPLGDIETKLPESETKPLTKDLDSKDQSAKESGPPS